MFEYRLLPFVLPLRSREALHEFLATSDQTAIAHAISICGRRDAELWEGDRFVALISYDPQSA